MLLSFLSISSSCDHRSTLSNRSFGGARGRLNLGPCASWPTSLPLNHIPKLWSEFIALNSSFTLCFLYQTVFHFLADPGPGHVACSAPGTQAGPSASSERSLNSTSAHCSAPLPSSRMGGTSLRNFSAPARVQTEQGIRFSWTHPSLHNHPGRPGRHGQDTVSPPQPQTSVSLLLTAS